MVSTAYLENHQDAEVAVKREDLERCNEGLLVLSGALRGALAQALLQDESLQVDQLVEFWTSVFKDRFYIELQYTQRENESDYVAKAIKLARQTALPVVASNDVCFLNKEDFNSHEIKVCIAEGRTLNDKHRQRGLYSPEQYLKSADEMMATFKGHTECDTKHCGNSKTLYLRTSIRANTLAVFPYRSGSQCRR